MKLLKTLTSLALNLTLLSSLAGCTGLALYKNTNDNVSDVQAQISAVDTKLNKAFPQPDYSSKDLRYNATTAALPSAQWYSQPAWVNKRISMRGQTMPFNFWVDKILSQTGANVSYQDGMNQTVPVAFNYNGTIHGALDKLTDMTGFSYTVADNTVSWKEFVTKTFDISFLPGASQYLMGGQAGAAGSSNTSAASSSAGTSMAGQTLGSQYSNMQGSLSVWTDLENSIKEMLSKDGQVMVSQATTTVTVHDRPQNVRVISDYLASMNKDLSRQVALQVQVLQIKLDKAFSYGIDWNQIGHNISVQGGLSGVDQTSLGGNLISVGGITPTGLGYGLMRTGNPRILINALDQQGQVSTVTNPRVVTLNNQVAQIAITTQKTYLASQTVTTTAQVGSSVSLTPGVVTTGFTLYVLPKITNHDVFLQLTSELSNLDDLRTINGGEPINQTTSGSSSTNQASTAQIQAPTVSSKSFNQRVMVPSNYTLVLSGFRQVMNDSNKSSLLGIDPLGSRGAQQDNTEILVLITPIIVGDNSQ